MTAGSDEPSQTVLLVDDEPIARSQIAEYLRECGYRVLEAANPAEAIQALGGHEIDIVVSEVELRDAGGGFGLAAWLREHQPDVQLILTSSIGRSADAAANLCEQGPTLHKPYHPQQLLDRIRRLRSR